MVNEELRKYIAEINETAVLFDNPSFDNSIIGISNTDGVVYDYDLMVEELMKDKNMDCEEAQDFISYNTLGSIGN